MRVGLWSGEVRGMLADGTQYYAKSIYTIPLALDTTMLSANADRPLSWLRRFVVVEMLNQGTEGGWRWQFSGAGISRAQVVRGLEQEGKANVDEARDELRIGSWGFGSWKKKGSDGPAKRCGWLSADDDCSALRGMSWCWRCKVSPQGSQGGNDDNDKPKTVSRSGVSIWGLLKIRFILKTFEESICSEQRDVEAFFLSRLACNQASAGQRKVRILRVPCSKSGWITLCTGRQVTVETEN